MFLVYPQPGMLLSGHPGGVNWYEWKFWTPAVFCDLGQQTDLYTKTILVTLRSWNFLLCDMDLRSCTDRLICAICMYVFLVQVWVDSHCIEKFAKFSTFHKEKTYYFFHLNLYLPRSILRVKLICKWEKWARWSCIIIRQQNYIHSKCWSNLCGYIVSSNRNWMKLATRWPYTMLKGAQN